MPFLLSFLGKLAYSIVVAHIISLMLTIESNVLFCNIIENHQKRKSRPKHSSDRSVCVFYSHSNEAKIQSVQLKRHVKQNVIYATIKHFLSYVQHTSISM